eukprot:gene10739-7468_t
MSHATPGAEQAVPPAAAGASPPAPLLDAAALEAEQVKAVANLSNTAKPTAAAAAAAAAASKLNAQAESFTPEKTKLAPAAKASKLSGDSAAFIPPGVIPSAQMMTGAAPPKGPHKTPFHATAEPFTPLPGPHAISASVPLMGPFAFPPQQGMPVPPPPVPGQALQASFIPYPPPHPMGPAVAQIPSALSMPGRPAPLPGAPFVPPSAIPPFMPQPLMKSPGIGAGQPGFFHPPPPGMIQPPFILQAQLPPPPIPKMFGCPPFQPPPELAARATHQDAVPSAHPLSAPASGTLSVNVGNAALAALESKLPPKFSCVLLTGLPATGKTSVGRKVVQSLVADGLGWSFFSGADVISGEKRSTWDSVKEVLDALSNRLDELHRLQAEHQNVKGLVIDKNCKTIEEVYYISGLLQSKGVAFVGVVGLEADADEILLERLGGSVAEQKERLKYHRVMQSAIVGLAKSAGMYHKVDAARPVEEVQKALRVQILSCSAQPPSRILRPYSADSKACPMVEDYQVYHRVITKLHDYVAGLRPGEFPHAPGGKIERFSNEHIADKERIEAIKKRYGVRRIVGGSRYLLFHFEGKLYLVHSSLRAVLAVPIPSWMGTPLTSLGTFVLEGDLVRLSGATAKEKFLVVETHYWSEMPNTIVTASLPANAAAPPPPPPPATHPRNLVLGLSWKDRQTMLERHILPECHAFFPNDVHLIVVHQTTEPITAAVKLLDSQEYPCEGLLLLPLNAQGGDRALEWRQPYSITVNFRVGPCVAITSPAPSPAVTPTHKPPTPALTPTRDGAVTRYALEVYNRTEKRYEQFHGATLDVRHSVMEGCIVLCSMKDTSQKHWTVRKIRMDLTRPAFKHDVEDTLSNCLVPRAVFVNWLIHDIGAWDPASAMSLNTSRNATSGTALHCPAASATSSAPPSAPAGVAHHPAPAPASAPAPAADPAPAAPTPSPPAARSPARHRPPVAGSDPKAIELLASIVPSMQIVRDTPAPATSSPTPSSAAAQPSSAGRGKGRQGPARARREASARQERQQPHHSAARPAAAPAAAPADDAPPPPPPECPECRLPKSPEELRYDRRSKKTLCYDCWYLKGHAYCCRCLAFSTGKRAPASARPEDFCCHRCVTAEDIAAAERRKKERQRKKAGMRKERADADPDIEAGGCSGPADSEEHAEERRSKGDTEPAAVAPAPAPAPATGEAEKEEDKKKKSGIASSSPSNSNHLHRIQEVPGCGDNN